MPDSMSPGLLRERLTDWTSAGLITAAQADRIAAAEAAREPSPVTLAATAADAAGTPQRLPLVVEALGYLGGAVAIGAGFAGVVPFWSAIPPWAELVLVGVTTAALAVAGFLLRAGQPALGRLRSVLYLMSAGGVAGFTGILTSHPFWNLHAGPALLVTEAVALAYAGLLWWRNRATLQHLTVFALAAGLVATAIAQAWSGPEPWAAGLGVWVLSVAWGVAAYRGRLGPLTAGYVAAGVGTLVAAQILAMSSAGQVLSVATVAGLLAAGVALRRVLLIGFGAIGAVQILPQVATRYLHGGVGAAAAIFAVGLVMVAIAVWLARTRLRAQSPSGRAAQVAARPGPGC